MEGVINATFMAGSGGQFRGYVFLSSDNKVCFLASFNGDPKALYIRPVLVGYASLLSLSLQGPIMFSLLHLWFCSENLIVVSHLNLRIKGCDIYN